LGSVNVEWILSFHQVATVHDVACSESASPIINIPTLVLAEPTKPTEPAGTAGSQAIEAYGAMLAQSLRVPARLFGDEWALERFSADWEATGIEAVILGHVPGEPDRWKVFFPFDGTV
jgi:hypothetical protein